MIRYDEYENKLYCDSCDYRVRLYVKNTIIAEQERSKEQLKHECKNNRKIEKDTTSLHTYWSNAFIKLS